MLKTQKKFSMAKIAIVIVLALVLVFAITACGEKPASTTPTVTGISIEKQPTQKEVELGGTFNYTGAQIKISYDDSTSKIVDVTSGMVGYYTFSKVGVEEITITYVDKGVSYKTTVSVTVKDTVGELRVGAINQIKDYEKQCDDTVIIALRNAYVARVNLENTASVVNGYVTEFKAAVDAYLGNTGSGDLDALQKALAALEAQAAELKAKAEAAEKLAKETKDLLDKIAAAESLQALKIAEDSVLKAAFKTYNDNKDYYYANALMSGATVLRAAIDNFKAIEDAFEAGKLAIVAADTSAEIATAKDTALAKMAAAKKVTVTVLEAVLEAMANPIVVEMVYRGNYFLNIGETLPVAGTKVEYYAQDSNATIVNLERMIQQALNTGVAGITAFINTEKNVNNEKTIADVVAEMRTKHTALQTAKNSAEAKAFFNAVKALPALNTLAPAVIDPVNSTAQVTVYTVAGSLNAIKAVNDAYEAFLAAYFDKDRTNENIERILNTYLYDTTTTVTVGNAPNAVTVGNGPLTNTTGYIAAKNAANAAWDNLVKAAADTAASDIVRAIYALGNGVDAVAAGAYGSTPPTIVNIVRSGDKVLYTDYDKIVAIQAQITALQTKYNLTTLQVEAIVFNTLAKITKSFEYTTTGTTKANVSLDYYRKAGDGVLSLLTFADVKTAATRLLAAKTAFDTVNFNTISIPAAINALGANYVTTYASYKAITDIDLAIDAWIAASNAAYGGSPLDTQSKVTKGDANYKIMVSANFINYSTQLAYIMGTGRADALALLAAINAIGSVTTASSVSNPVDATNAYTAAFKATLIGNARDKYDAFIKALSTNKVNASNKNLLADFSVWNPGQNTFTVDKDANNVTMDHDYLLAILVAAEKSYVEATIAAIGGQTAAAGIALVTAADGKTWTPAPGVAQGTAITTAEAAYKYWSTKTATTALSDKFGAVTYDFVALLKLARADYAVASMSTAITAAAGATATTADAAGAAASALRMAAIKAYDEWVKTNPVNLYNVDGSNNKGAEMNTIYTNEIAYVKALIAAVHTNIVVASAASTSFPAAPYRAPSGDSKTGIDAARTAYDALAKYLTFTVKYMNAAVLTTKTFTVANIDTYATLTKAEAMYAQINGWASIINGLLVGMPNDITNCTYAHVAALTELAKVYEWYRNANRFNIVQVGVDDYTWDVDLTSLGFDPATNMNNKFIVYFGVDGKSTAVVDQIAKVTFVELANNAKTAMQALANDYRLSKLTNLSINEVINLYQQFVIAVDGLVTGLVGNGNYNTQVTALNALVTQYQKLMEDA